VEDFQTDQILVVVGNYGSGKTEVAVNLAIERKKAGVPVDIIDLDLVNPYFRTREARRTLRSRDINVILPPEQYLNADLPILSPGVSAALRRRGALVIVDAGGDGAGARVLASLAGDLRGRRVNTLQAVNPLRPETETFDGCARMREKIEAASHLRVDGVIGNANLLEETTVEHIYDGGDFVKALARRFGVPLAFVTVPAALAADLDSSRIDCPVLIIRRQLVPPWLKPAYFV